MPSYNPTPLPSIRFYLKAAAAIVLFVSCTAPSSALIVGNTSSAGGSTSARHFLKRNMMSMNGGGVPPLPSVMPAPLKVAIIGAGAAGLATARALDRVGITARIFEKDSSLGGVWNYRPNSKTCPVYRGLRTNLPREIMAFRELQWGGDGKTLSYVSHGEVREYLRRYAETYNLERLISFGCSVKQLAVETNTAHFNSEEEKEGSSYDWPKVILEWEENDTTERNIMKKEVFDAVCICNGHYAAPSIPQIPGMEEYYKGSIIHSVEYDDPAVFKDQTVLCVGGRASGEDLAREISSHATKVYLSDTTCHEKKSLDNIVWVPKTMSVDSDGSIKFGNYSDLCDIAPKVDVVIFCSGYDYQFPFINEDSNLELSVIFGDRRVKPLYEQLWHARYPSVAFVGLQHSVVPFPFFEVQADAITSQLLKTTSGKSSSSWSLPPLEERLRAAKRDANSGGPKETGAGEGRVQDTHFLGSYQWDAAIKYAKFAGICNDALVKYIHTSKAIYDHSSLQRKGSFPGGPDVYRYGSYIRDDDNESFEVESMLEQTEVIQTVPK